MPTQPWPTPRTSTGCTMRFDFEFQARELQESVDRNRGR